MGTGNGLAADAARVLGLSERRTHLSPVIAREITFSLVNPSNISRLNSVFRPCQAAVPPTLSPYPPTAVVMAVHNGSEVASTFPDRACAFRSTCRR